MVYFEVTPTEFFDGLEDDGSLCSKLREKLGQLKDDDLQKVALFIEWIEK